MRGGVDDGWERVDAVYRRALERPAGERQAFLVQACTGDEPLRRAVDALLAADREAEEAGFLAHSARVTWARLWQRATAEGREARAGRMRDRTGERLGPWELGGVLGRGGMATVHRARRVDGAFEQEVAVKVVRPSLAADRLVRRLRAEREILSGLDHPGIARILDGGATGDGLPYLVMELVDGRPITAHCDREGLGLDERLALFLEVLDAVEHAHRRLVLHRDLKPSNILVTDEGRVRLLDFGIAKLMDPDAGVAAPTLTRTGTGPLTPDCASPEQLRGEPVTTASDVYQLGVLLYRLLAGRPPYRLPDGPAPALLRAFQERKVLPPSERAAGNGEEGGTAVAPSQLRGDLDTIVMKALREDPAERYPSAEALAEDLRLFREGRPIRARPPRWSYRLRKLLGRHRWLAPVAVATVLAVVGYGWTLQRHAAELERERNVARAEAAKAEQVKEFLVTVFESGDPEVTPGDTLTARTLLERGARRAEAGLADRPELQAEMFGVLGRAMKNLGFHDRAEPLLTRTVALRRQLYGERDLRVAGGLRELADLAFEKRSDWEGAAARYREALAIERAGLPPGDPALVPSLRGLAVVLRGLRRLDSAELHLDEALAIAARDPGPNSETYARLLADRALFLYVSAFDAGKADDPRWEEARSLYMEALERMRTLHGDRHPFVPRTLRFLARLEYYRGRTDESIRRFRESLDLHAALYGRGHPETLLTASNLARTLVETGRHEEAIRLERASVAAAEERWPDGHRRVGDAYRALARRLFAAGRPEEGEAALLRATEVFGSLDATDDP